MNLIRECRTSVLTDKRWCQEHNIQPSNFYYHIRRFRDMACKIPKSIATDSRADMHEVAQIFFDEPMVYQPERKPIVAKHSFDVAIRISVNGFQVELSNNAARDNPGNTFRAAGAVLDDLSGVSKIFVIIGLSLRYFYPFLFEGALILGCF